MRCGSCGTYTTRELLPATAGVYYRPSMPARPSIPCCPLCASGWDEVIPAGAGGYYPAGGSTITLTPAEQAAADAERRRLEQRTAEQRARDEQASRDAVLRGLGTITGAAQTGINEGFATERTRIEAEQRTAQERARSQAEVERIRLETQRDIEVARARAAQPNVSLSPLETTPPTPAPRTDSASQQFPTGAVIGIGAAALLLLALAKGK